VALKPSHQNRPAGETREGRSRPGAGRPSAGTTAADTGRPKAPSERLGVARACFGVAAANLLDQKPRVLAAIAGVAVALFLLLLQLSILHAAREKVTALYDDFDFDIAIVPDSYQFLISFDTMDRIVLDIARATGDVADTYGLNIDVVHWTQVPSGQVAYNLLIGLDQPAAFVRDRDIRAGWNTLSTPHTLIADRYSQPSAGPVSPGSTVEIHDERMTVRGQFKLGLFFYAEGAALVRNVDFSRLTGRDPHKISIGLVKLRPGISLTKARADLAGALPSGTLVMTKAQLEQQERAYFLSTKPIGIMIYISMVIACLVGAAIILQVLSTDVANRIGEYAVLKAMGASPHLVYGVGMGQAAIVGLGGLLPALALGWLVLGLIQYQTHLETGLSVTMILKMLAITAVLAAAAGAFAVRRVDQADPASLF
jgi:putative ABC transport system permease protein